MGNLLSNNNVITNSSTLNKSLLSRINIIRKVRFKSISQRFSNNFIDDITKANGSLVTRNLMNQLFRNESNIHRIEPVQVSGLEAGEVIDHKHDVFLDNVPAGLEEFSGESVRHQCFVTRKGEDRSLDFILRNSITKRCEVMVSTGDGSPIDGLCTRGTPFHKRSEMRVDDTFF